MTQKKPNQKNDFALREYSRDEYIERSKKRPLEVEKRKVELLTNTEYRAPSRIRKRHCVTLAPVVVEYLKLMAKGKGLSAGIELATDIAHRTLTGGEPLLAYSQEAIRKRIIKELAPYIAAPRIRRKERTK